MRIATWNVNSIKQRLDSARTWLAERKPDIVCLQETKQADAKFPTADFTSLGYESAHHGDGRWNGVALLSRIGLTDIVRGFGTDLDDHVVRAQPRGGDGLADLGALDELLEPGGAVESLAQDQER